MAHTPPTDVTLNVAKLAALFSSLAAALYAATQAEPAPILGLFLSFGPLLAARRGIGTALLRLAEAHAVENRATSIHVEAEFYKANGFIEAGHGETRLMSGRPIACVFMRKDLVAAYTAGSSQ